MGETEKEITVTARPVSDDYISPSNEKTVSEAENAARKPHHNLAAAVWTIVCGVALPCIPVLVVSGVLLYFIFHYRLEDQPGWAELQLPVNHTHTQRSVLETLNFVRHQGGGPAYYVHFNPSTITTIASWTGRVIPYLSSSIMALVAFFAARSIVHKSQHGDGTDLPSPEQLTILIGLLGGSSFGPLKDTLLYRWMKKERLVDPIPFAFYALFLVTFVAVLIPIADTWFGIATTPAVITQLYNTTSASYQSFGRVLSTGPCDGRAGSMDGLGGMVWVPCNLWGSNNVVDAVIPSLQDAPEVSLITQGMSIQNTVLNYTHPDGTVYYYMADTGMNAQLDFKAKTLAVTTQCKPISRQCMQDHSMVPEDGILGQYNFTCSPGFQANYTFSGKSQTIDALAQDGGSDQVVGNPIVGLAFAPDAELSSRVGTYVPNLEQKYYDYVDSHKATVSPDLYVLRQNPIHFATWASGFVAVPQNDLSYLMWPPLLRDPEILNDNINTYWILGCEASVFDVQYTWVNGSVFSFDAALSSAAMGGLVSGPFAFQVPQASISLTAATNLAIIQNSSAALADSFASSWSKAAVGMTIGALQSAKNEIEQVRNSTVSVARVPIVPLYLLLGLKLFYVVAVLVLAAACYLFTHPAETQAVKAQLSAKGLAAAHFDTPNLVQKTVVQEIQSRLQKSKSDPNLPATAAATAEEREAKEQAEVDAHKLKKAKTEPIAGSRDPSERKVALVPHANGGWRFAVVADGVWQSIKPVAVNLLELGAAEGALGTTGDVINAWVK